MRVLAASCALSLTFVACATTQTYSTVEPSPVIARYGERQIRQAEVDVRAADELQKLEEQLFDLRADTAERIALEALVEQEAKKTGVSEEAWLERQLDAGPALQVTDEQMRGLFDKAKGRLPPEVTFEDVKPQLRQAIEREGKSKRAREIFTQLKKKAGYELVLKAPQRPRKVVDAAGPTRGDANAKITLIEFADFECPYCARALEAVESVLAAYPGKIRFVFRHFPLSIHAKAPKAAEAAACADEQGQFWKFHDALFASQELELDALKQQATHLGLDLAKFDACLGSSRPGAVVKRDLAAGQLAGVSGTPAFFINGIMLSGAQPEEAFRKIIDAELERLEPSER